MKEREYENVPTGIPGVELRVLKGKKLDIPQEIIQLFYETARLYGKAKEGIEVQTNQQKERREEIIKFVKALDGLRGVRSVNDDLDLLVVEKEAEEWERELLKASLGPRFTDLVSEEFIATIAISTGPGIDITEEKLRQGITKLLEELGIKSDEIPKMFGTEVELRIDTDKLDELIEAGRVKLLPETKDVSTTWSVNVDQLRKSQKLKAGGVKKKTK